jgi:hypothetical protein
VPFTFLEHICHRSSSVVARRAFWEIGKELTTIPDLPGVYVLYGNHRFDYPVGKSPIFYIGQSANLRERLETHWRFAYEARCADRKLTLYFPRYEYAAVFGSWYAFARTWQGLTPRALEEEAMASFAHQHRSFPIANGAGSWARVGKFEGVDFDD